MLFVRDFIANQQVLGRSDHPLNPLVSVILPTYRRFKSGLLERSIRSVLAQQMDNFELIIMDDGSIDGSYDLIERLRRRDHRIIHVRHDQNSGLPGLRCNEGIELSKGKYIAFQFDDDVWRPNALISLVRAIENQPGLSVMVGKGLFNGKVGEVTLPTTEVTNITLNEQNRFANNCVIMPRDLFSIYGMYDPHIAMRRLCDWDLWLRLVKVLPFFVIDDIVADIYEYNEGSIARTVPYDLSLFRFVNSIPRNELLTPERWHDYQVDSLEINGFHLPGDIRRRAYEEQIITFYFNLRHRFPGLEGFTPTLPPEHAKTLLYVKQTYEIGNDIVMNNFDELANARKSYKSYYQSVMEVKSNWPAEADMLMLMRTIEDPSCRLLEQALRYDRPVTYCMDDDLLTFHEFGPKFAYMAPGTPLYANLVYQLQNVDSVIVTNEFIGKSVREYNPRVILDNGSIPERFLPDQILPRDNTSPVRIGYVGSGYRIDEFKLIWDALLKISQEYGDRLEFEFWGLDVSSLPKLSSPVSQRSFTFSYYYYLEKLKNAKFDILLIPMLDHPRPRLGKARIKYYETAVAGALGIFSDVPQYQKLDGEFTCVKAKNTAEDWYTALKTTLEMNPEDLHDFRTRCLMDVREEFTVEGQIHNHEVALRAAEFHGKTRHQRHEDGKPRVAYFIHSPYKAGAEIQLWRRLYLARSYGVEPVVAIPSVFRDVPQAISLAHTLEEEGIPLEFVDFTCYTEPRDPLEYQRLNENTSIKQMLETWRPALVHSLTFIPALGQVCTEMGIPHVASLYQIDDEFAWHDQHIPFEYCSLVQSDTLRYATRWSQLLDGAPKMVSRGMASHELLEVGKRRLMQLKEPGETIMETTRIPEMVVMGTFQERKQQLQIIEALGQLKEENESFHLSFYGFTQFFPDYVERCRRLIRKYQLEENVTIHEFNEDVAGILKCTDILLTLSTEEGLPTSISDAAAAGVLVVATPVGGIHELIIDGISGILCRGTQVEDLVSGIKRALTIDREERKKIILQARRTARSEFHPYRVINDLFSMYNLVLEKKQAGQVFVFNPLPVVQQATETITRENSPGLPPNSVIKLGPGLKYPFTPKKGGWSGLDILIGTNLRSASGKLVLSVKTEAGYVIRTTAVDMANAHDNDWVQFRFDPIRNAAGRRFFLELRLNTPGAETILSIYQSSPPEPRPIKAVRWLGRNLRIRMPGGQLYYRDWYRTAVQG